MGQFKAGAGLPYIENRFIKYLLIPTARVVLNWERSLKMIEHEEKKIKSLLDDIPQEQYSKIVTIGRVFGIEDHTRNFSINMVLEHLNIVTQAMIFVIGTLSKEKPVEKEIKIEGVKPTHNDNSEVDKFFQTIREYKLFIKKHDKKPSQMTKQHPWFVDFNNQDWAIFTAIHTFIHRRQLQTIIKALN